jgi:hypothetical protein
MQVDLSPVITPLLSVVGIALATAATWALTKLGQKWGIDKNTAVMANLNTAAMNGISAAVMAAQQQIKAKGWDHPEVQNALVATAASYVADKFPDTLAKAGLDPSTTQGQQDIRDLVTRALPAGVAAAAASPTTPPVPPIISAPPAAKPAT